MVDGSSRKAGRRVLITGHESGPSRVTFSPGLTSQAVLETFSKIQLLDVYIPTHDHRTLHLQRYTEPEKEHRILLEKLNLRLLARIAKMESGDPSVSIDLLIRSLFAIGSTQRDIVKALA